MTMSAVATDPTVAYFLRRLKKNDVRADKVKDIKARIENGTYETPESEEKAIENVCLDSRWCFEKRT